MGKHTDSSSVVLFSEDNGIVGSRWSPVQMVLGDLEAMGYLSGAFSSAEDLEDALANADESIAAVMIVRRRKGSPVDAQPCGSVTQNIPGYGCHAFVRCGGRHQDGRRDIVSDHQKTRVAYCR